MHILYEHILPHMQLTRKCSYSPISHLCPSLHQAITFKLRLYQWTFALHSSSRLQWRMTDILTPLAVRTRYSTPWTQPWNPPTVTSSPTHRPAATRGPCPESVRLSETRHLPSFAFQWESLDEFSQVRVPARNSSVHVRARCCNLPTQRNMQQERLRRGEPRRRTSLRGRHVEQEEQDKAPSFAVQNPSNSSLQNVPVTHQTPRQHHHRHWPRSTPPHQAGQSPLHLLPIAQEPPSSSSASWTTSRPPSRTPSLRGT